jgi:hypothetical protein
MPSAPQDLIELEQTEPQPPPKRGQK